MVGFIVGLLLGASIGVIVCSLMQPCEDGEYVDWWIRHCARYKQELEDMKQELSEHNENVQATIDDLTELLDREIWEL